MGNSKERKAWLDRSYSGAEDEEPAMRTVTLSIECDVPTANIIMTVLDLVAGQELDFRYIQAHTLDNINNLTQALMDIGKFLGQQLAEWHGSQPNLDSEVWGGFSDYVAGIRRKLEDREKQKTTLQHIHIGARPPECGVNTRMWNSLRQATLEGHGAFIQPDGNLDAEEIARALNDRHTRMYGRFPFFIRNFGEKSVEALREWLASQETQEKTGDNS